MPDQSSHYKRSLTKLALEVHWTSNLSEFPLRVAFARAVLRSSMSSRPRLEGFGGCGAPNARDWSRFWRVEHINKNPAERISRVFMFRKSELLISVIPKQLQQINEHVNEVQIKLESAENRQLLNHFWLICVLFKKRTRCLRIVSG